MKNGSFKLRHLLSVFSFSFVFLLFLSSVACSTPRREVSKNLIITSMVPVATLIENITHGAGWHVEYLVKPGIDNPHAFSLKPSDAFKVEKAALVFAVGCGMDPYLEKSVPENERRRFVDLGKHVFLKEPTLMIPGNPHWWLDPYLLLIAARKVRDTFVSMDGANSELYARNYAYFKSAVEDLLKKKQEFYSLKSKKVASLTATFAYMFRRYGIKEVTLIPHTGYAPSGNDVTVFLNSITMEGMNFLLIPNVYAGRIHETIREEYKRRLGRDLKIVTLDAVGYDFRRGRTVFILDAIEKDLDIIKSLLSGGN